MESQQLMNIENRIFELQELVSKYEMESFVGNLAYFIKRPPDKEYDIDINKFDSRLKDFLYLIALNTFSGKRGSEKFEFPFNELGVIADTLNLIKDSNHIKKFNNYSKESIIHEMAFRNHFDNGVLSYVEQDLERLKNIFIPFEDKIVQDFGLNINFLIDICKEIELVSIVRHKYITNFTLTEEFADFNEKIRSKQMTFSKAFDLLPKNIQEVFRAFETRPYDSLMFKAEDLYNRLDKEKVDSFLQLFSCEPLPDPKIRYYSSDSPFELTPILKLPNENYLSICGKQIPISIYKKLYSHIFKDEKFKDRLRRHKEKFIEKKVVELFKEFFPSRDTFFYKNYFIEKNFEQDLLIIYRDTAIIVETKAYKLREPFRDVEKAVKRLKDDFKASIQYGFEQCLRVEDYFVDDHFFEIKDGKGNLLHTVNPKKIQNVFTLVVTLDRFGSLQTDLSLMLQKDEDIDYPWSVYIDDLEIFLLAIKHNIKNPVNQFFNFLKLRRKMHSRIYAVDELDVCGVFLRSPETFKQYSEASQTFLTFLPHEQEVFDEYYRSNKIRFKEKPLPDDFYRFGIS
ncbi:NERD domain-containing protein [Flectobacillus roseus]